MTPPPDSVTLCVAAHPFSAARRRVTRPAGETLADMVAAAQPDALLRRHAHVFIAGHPVPPARWPQVRPKPGTQVEIRMVPMGGGGGKNPLRTVLSLAVMAAAPAIGTAMGGMLGTGVMGRIMTTGLNLVGRLALNALAPPPRPRLGARQKESPTLFIQSARNQATPFARVPKVLGRHRFVPPLGALPYTETIGNDQYIRMLFVWGYGPLRIGDLKIGETPLGEFDGVEIETREGWPDDAPLTLYANSVMQNDMDVALKQSGGWALRTTEANVDEISIDITCPRGLLAFNKSGKRKATAVTIEVQCAPAGTPADSGNWSAPATGYKTVAAQQSPDLPRPAAIVRNGVSHAVSRADIIALHAMLGSVAVFSGTAAEGTAPADPLVPAGYLPLARVIRRADDGDTIDPARITDLRGGISVFGGGGDFAVTASSTDKRVEIAGGNLRFAGITLSAQQSSALRRALSFRVPAGQYDVRLRRLTPDAADDNTFDDTHWTALRSLRYAYPVTMKNIAMTALRIKATDQLNGVIDRLNGVVESVIPDFTGSGWALQPTSNPAALYRHVLQGEANARALSDNRIDLARIEEWHAYCAQNGRSFNAVIDYDVSVQGVLQDIAAAGRASPSVLDGKWAVVIDRPQNVPVQHFTPHNARGFRGEKDFDEIPAALRVRFVNKNKGWAQDERLVYDDGVTAETAQRYETLDLAGTTDPQQAWKDGRYHIATARLRPESYSFYCDIEHIVCTRGDLIRLTHDVPMFGLSSARVAAADGAALTLDAAVTIETGKSYALRLRRPDGASEIYGVTTAAGTHKTVTLSPAPATPVEAGMLCLFGESGRESVEMIVKAIEPQADLSARITCIDAAPAVHAADQGAIPAHSSQITLPAELQRPPAPVLAGIQSDEAVMLRSMDGSVTSRIRIALAPPVTAAALSPVVRVRYAGEAAFRPAEILQADAAGVSIGDVDEGDILDIDLRYRSAAGVLSPPLQINQYVVAGGTAPPADVEGLQLTVLGDAVHLSWEAVRDIDLSHYHLRFTPATGSVSWSNAIDLAPRIARQATSIAVPAASGTYLLKAVDLGGRASMNAAVAVTTQPALNQHNSVMTLDIAPAFDGAHENTIAIDSGLQLGGADDWNDWEDIDALDNIDFGALGLAASGIYTHGETADLGEVYTCRLSADLAVSALDMNQSIDTVGDLDLMEDMDQAASPSLWSAALQLRTTDSDPDAAPVWGDWQDFVIGDYSGRAFQFRVRLAAQAAHITPCLSALSVTIDMPDRTAAGTNLAAPAAGLAVSFERPFRDIPAVAITPRDLASGDYYSLTAIGDAGFTVRFFDAGGDGVARHFDYIAKGFGSRQP